MGGSLGQFTIDGGTLDGAPLSTGRAADLGQNSGSSGTATVSNGGSWTTRNLIVALNGAGVLNVNGGTVAVSGGDGNNTGFLTVGSQAGLQGTMTIGAGGVVRNDQPAQMGATLNFLTNIGYQGTAALHLRRRNRRGRRRRSRRAVGRPAAI